MRVLVLGCGPAGLMAAHGAVVSGTSLGVPVEVGVISRKRKSELFGAQYLHSPIPMLPKSPKVSVRYRLEGSADDYRYKVYGPTWSGSVSPEELDADHDAWDIRSTYDRLWERYESHITDGELSHNILKGLLMHERPDIVINSVHRQSLCRGEHNFGFTTIWAAGDAPERGIKIPYPCPENTIICDGSPDVAWYRKSRVFGHTTVEWPSNMRGPIPIPTAAQVIKPTYHNCDCWPDILHVGRYGRWEKGVLSHTAFVDAQMATIRKIRESANATA